MQMMVLHYSNSLCCCSPYHQHIPLQLEQMFLLPLGWETWGGLKWKRWWTRKDEMWFDQPKFCAFQELHEKHIPPCNNSTLVVGKVWAQTVWPYNYVCFLLPQGWGCFKKWPSSHIQTCQRFWDSGICQCQHGLIQYVRSYPQSYMYKSKRTGWEAAKSFQSIKLRRYYLFHRQSKPTSYGKLPQQFLTNITPLFIFIPEGWKHWYEQACGTSSPHRKNIPNAWHYHCVHGDGSC